MSKIKGLIAFVILFSAVPYTSSAWEIKDNIYAAAKAGDIHTLENYLYRGYSIDTSGSDGMTALCSASWDYDPYAYDLLIRYGANPNADCMYGKPTRTSSAISSKGVLIAGGVALAAGGVIALAASGGGGGGGNNNTGDDNNQNNNNNTGNDNNQNNNDNTGNDDNQNNNDNTGDDNNQNNNDNTGDDNNQNNDNTGNDDNQNNNDNTGDDNNQNNNDNTGSGNNQGGVSFTPYDEISFRNDYEFNSSEYSNNYYGGTKFLNAINAAPAYAKYYGTDNLGNFTNILSGHSTVGIIDNGVDGSLVEFSDGAGGSKVSGYNFDYGPCNGSDRKNCWLEEYNSKGYYTLTFYDADGKKTKLKHTIDFDSYKEWFNAYPDGYNWDIYKERADSFYPVASDGTNPLVGGDYTHGTHVAGIIAANRDGNGIMGVAFTNTDIKAVRWDFMSSLYEPIKQLVDDGVVAINMSLGTEANSQRSSYNYNNTSLSMLEGWKEAAAYTIGSYVNYSSGAKSYKEGTIWVKAAGNSGYAYPDLESGIKLIGTYSNLMMLTVVNVNVYVDAYGKISSYGLAMSSNSCGNTSGYCIAAPGNDIYSTKAGGDYYELSGTSQAAPMVTGAIAFLKNAFPSLRSEQIINLLMNTANKNTYDYSESKYGAGLLDLGAAMSYQSPLSGTSGVVTVSGNNLSSASYVRIDNASLTLSAPLAQALQKALPESITAFDAYDRAFDYPTSNYIRASHSGYKQFKNDVSYIIPNRQKQDVWKNNIHFAYASGGTYNKPLNYMLSEYKHGKHTSGFYFSSNNKYQNNSGRHADMNNPFMSFNSAYGITHAYAINPKLSFTTEIAGGENGLYDGDDDYNDTHFKKAAYGFNSGFAYEYKKNLKLGVSGGLLHEDNALLGSNGENAFSFAGGQTYYFGLNATWQFMKKWSLSGSWYQGYSKAQSTNSKMLQTSDLVSNGFAADLNYQYDNSLDMGLRLSSPLRIEKGTMSVDFASGRAIEDDTVYRNRYATTLKPQKREYKLAFYGNKEINDNVSFSSEFDIRFNPEHTNASNDYRALLGLSWNF